jgi:RNA polymerase I-specific transcription initiation factor RRN7
MTDTEMLGAHTMKKRALKSGKKKKGRPSKANPKLYHGDSARFHYFQCLQLLLRKQVAALTRLWRVPDVFEVVCRDLWALHISLLEQPIPAEPYYHQLETSDIKVSQPEDATLEEESSSDSDGDEELEELMRQNSEISSEDEEDNDEADASRPVNESSGGRRSTSKRASETPLSTIVILILTCWTLRIPALHRDFIRYFF